MQLPGSGINSLAIRIQVFKKKLYCKYTQSDHIVGLIAFYYSDLNFGKCLTFIFFKVPVTKTYNTS